MFLRKYSFWNSNFFLWFTIGLLLSYPIASIEGFEAIILVVAHSDDSWTLISLIFWMFVSRFSLLPCDKTCQAESLIHWFILNYPKQVSTKQFNTYIYFQNKLNEVQRQLIQIAQFVDFESKKFWAWLNPSFIYSL